MSAVDYNEDPEGKLIDMSKRAPMVEPKAVEPHPLEAENVELQSLLMALASEADLLRDRVRRLEAQILKPQIAEQRKKQQA